MVQYDFLYKVSGVGGQVIEWSLVTGPLLRPAGRYGGRAVTSVPKQNLEGVKSEVETWCRKTFCTRCRE